MRSSWTFSRKLALGFAVRRVIGEIEAEERTLLDARQTPRETEAGATRTLQTSS